MTGRERAESPRRPRAVDASMTLINELLAAPLDPGYAAAAERRKAGERAGRAQARLGPSSLVVLVTAIVIGVGMGAAVVSLRAPAQTRSAEHTQLAERIEAVNAGLTQRTEQVTALQADIARLQEAGSDSGGTALAEQAAALQLQSGLVPLAGPGVRIELDDAPSQTGKPEGDPGQRGGQFAEGRIASRDLQAVTNALWAAGAEGIAVNGHRLTSTTAIRFAGQAILVGYRPLTRPYVVTAIGSPQLAAQFESGPGGEYLRVLSSVYAAPTSVKAAEEVVLAAGTSVSLSHATAAPQPEPAGSGPTGDTTAKSAPPRKDPAS